MQQPRDRLRQSTRWQGFDYASAAAYFVTLCAEGRQWLLGEIVDGAMRLSEVGRIVDREWMRSGVVRSEVDIDVFCVMPNHLHGILTIRPSVGAHGGAPLVDVEHVDLNRIVANSSRAHRRAPLRPPRSLGSMIAGFKQATTTTINDLRGSPGQKVWQRGFYDRVVRDDDELNRIAEYIVTNPERWEQDDHYPADGPYGHTAVCPAHEQPVS